jgi:hypothetical protein
MMAKMFYTLDETKAALGRNEEEIKQLAREGRLREFRDGPRLMFKADQVEGLKNELGGGSPGKDQVDLGVSDTGAPIGMADSRGNTGSVISLADSAGGTGTGPGMILKDDTAMAADLGLSNSAGGIPSPGGSRSGSGSRPGINVLGPGESGADPMAQTAISSSIPDQVNLEGVGSGSGLLDLTRESDDTSLGAELLDEIDPGAGKPRPPANEASGAATVAAPALGTRPAAARGLGGGPVYQEAADPQAAAFGAASLAGAIMVILAAVAVVSAVLGTRPQLVQMFDGMGLLTVALIGIVGAIVFGVVGLVIGKAAK